MTELAIIIPGFNCDKYLDKCINSILKQNYLDYMIFFIDDGSTDSTKKIAQKYEATGKFKYIYQSNSGVSKARNKGIELLEEYEFVMFVDADDWLEENYLSVMVDKMKESCADYSFCNWKQYYYKNKNIECDVKRISEDFSNNVSVDELRMHYFRYRNGGAPWAKIYKTDIIKKYSIRFVDDLPYAEDYLFNLEYLKYVKKIIYIDIPLYGYNCLHIGEGSKFRKDYFDILKKVEDYKSKLYCNVSKEEYQNIYDSKVEQISVALVNLLKNQFTKLERYEELCKIRIYMNENKITLNKIIKSNVNIKSKVICILANLFYM